MKSPLNCILSEVCEKDCSPRAPNRLGPPLCSVFWFLPSTQNMYNRLIPQHLILTISLHQDLKMGPSGIEGLVKWRGLKKYTSTLTIFVNLEMICMVQVWNTSQIHHKNLNKTFCSVWTCFQLCAETFSSLASGYRISHVTSTFFSAGTF